jgi:hypothetical protein
MITCKPEDLSPILPEGGARPEGIINRSEGDALLSLLRISTDLEVIN